MTETLGVQAGRRRRRWAARAAASTAVVSGILLGTLPAHAAPTDSTGSPVSDTHQVFRAGNGIRLNYHYYADGVESERPSGAVFYFDGDGTRRFDQANSRFAERMAEAAAATDRAFVFVEAPGGTRSWRSGDTDRTAEAVRQFAATEILPAVDGPVLLTGYSGGAEFLVAGILDEGAGELPEGSGAVLIGGGGTYGRAIEPATEGTQDLQLTWVVGNRDGVGSTGVRGWSPLSVTSRAVSDFRGAGYTEAERKVVDGGHTSYDIPALVTQGLSGLDR